MINADGNYEFLDFDKEKPKFIETFVKFYGEKYRDIITQRINKIEYVPYLDRDFVSGYYGKTLTDKRDELVSLFCLLGAFPHNPEMDDLIWDSENGGSNIIYALTGGADLAKRRTLIDADTRKKILDIRDKISDAFHMSKEPVQQYQDIRRLYTIYRRAVARLSKDNPCDIIQDAQRFYANCARMTKLFYQTIRTNQCFQFTPRDIATINKSDFANGDLLGMDSYGMLYTGTLDTPGLVEYFTSENYGKIASINQSSTVSPEVLELLFGQLKGAYIMGAKPKYLTIDEIQAPGITFDQANIIKVLNEYNYQLKNYPSNFIDKDSADDIENTREIFASQLSSGCKFRSRLDKDLKSVWTHADNGDLQFCMYPTYQGQNPNKPNTTIFFNESEYYDNDVLLGNLIHEINHCVTHGRATKVVKNYSPVVKKGALGAVNKFLHFILRDRPKDGMGRAIVQQGLHYDKYMMKNGRILGGKTYTHPGMADLEENINERLAQEISALYLHKYVSPFRDSALYDEKSIAEEKEDIFQCQYELWDFITEDFYNSLYKAIKSVKINHAVPFYFGAGKLPENKTDRIMNFIKDKYERHLNPNGFKKSGLVDYQKVEKLGDLIASFKENILPLLKISEEAEFWRVTTGDYSDQTPEVQEAIKAYEREAKKITRSILADRGVPLVPRQKSNDFTPTNLITK